MLQEYQREWGWGLVGCLSFDDQGRWGLAQFRLIRIDRKRGYSKGGVKIGHFMDAINELSRADFENCSSFFQIPAKNIKVRNFL